MKTFYELVERVAGRVFTDLRVRHLPEARADARRTSEKVLYVSTDSTLWSEFPYILHRWAGDYPRHNKFSTE
jgi:hypothetical protein